ncbi:MAG: type I 3-dehydroquinate dehydratase [Cenarchaeum sp. SB0661_bin_35]|nr:type I 3-dehydroquinate dehydratase [Cenarchaeum sp. SB0667_bin_13]MXY37308.1 type I 3-dehydroquinate dehydratase [Cenarchaeum sp. SB0664_bin_35]MXZ93815.1 type I 3-dehydroquinate dehydratase [Cenarchaeum sp. SB0666_bin_15]MYC80211.1 type I 3-dehydroquinate dehydratase [Cenarchaeum sp. SB0661_bin_35]MYD58032.1 type I 3-dehydroquinate dehydratase [Cenarchaeum sp. SB0678_bin_8]MYI51692.1 type I 3-dehydroquinate dehydratase [Cenarchaeum sp. SB0673_bin_9]MYJ28092.1 type I 3-dehydroquinate dehy
MKYTTCVSIAHRSPEAALSQITDVLKSSEYVELRLDYLKSADDMVYLLEEAAPYMNRFICTLRPKSEGGMYDGAESQRIQMLKAISNHRPYLLDVEYSTITRGNLAAELSSNIMVSWHDFEDTPPLDALIHQMNLMADYSNIIKIATLARDAPDTARVLALYAHAKTGSLVAFAMGDTGRHSRLCAMHLGSPFMYVYVGKTVAPGQYSLQDVQTIEEDGLL